MNLLSWMIFPNFSRFGGEDVGWDSGGLKPWSWSCFSPFSHGQEWIFGFGGLPFYPFYPRLKDRNGWNKENVMNNEGFTSMLFGCLSSTCFVSQRKMTWFVWKSAHKSWPCPTLHNVNASGSGNPPNFTKKLQLGVDLSGWIDDNFDLPPHPGCNRH